MPLTSKDFGKTPYLVGADVKIVTETPASGTYRLVTGQATHDNSGNSQYQGVKKIAVKKGAGTIWLPYYQSSISCVELPMDGSATVALTDNLSGCAIYIGQDDDGKFYFTHANSQKGSTKEDLSGKPPTHQTTDALKELDKLAKDAGTKLGAKMKWGLSKARYNGAVGKLTKNTDDFIGGTTVAGFFAKGHWDFWFQTWGSVSSDGKAAAPKLIVAEQFFSTKDPAKFQ